MFKQLVVGTAVLAAALAVVPTTAQAQYFESRRERYVEHRISERERREHLRRERVRRHFEERYRYDHRR